MFKKIILGLIVLLSAMNIQAQNNAIFFGGSDDGWSGVSYVQVADQAIFLGGEDDGWSMANYIQPGDEAIFLGGEDDGWSMANYVQLGDEAIFLGGEGDGWATVVYPLGPLPVELLSFTGQVLNDTHVLDWSTSSEINSSHFVIEHSKNALNFLELGMQNASGNSSSAKSYSFTNKKPIVGNNYYRLKMVDIDGKSKYSNIILLKLLKDNSSIVLYPNPSANSINIDIISGNNTGNVSYQLLDVSGKILIQQNLENNTQSFKVDISSFANGLYFIKVNKNNGSEIIKFRISK